MKKGKFRQLLNVISRLAFQNLGMISFLFLVFASGVASSQEHLTLTTTASTWGGSCQPGSPNLLAGSSFKVSLLNLQNLPVVPLQRGWPEGYLLEAALDLTPGESFRATPGLIEQFRPSPYINVVNMAHERVIRDDPSNANPRSLNTKHFELFAPENLAGHLLTIRGKYQLGNVQIVSRTESIFIIAPCSQSDSARIVGSRIYIAIDSMNYEMATLLADSMIERGLSDAAGFYYAEISAERLSNYDKAIVYLDHLYEDYGVMSVDPNESNPPQFSRGVARDSDSQETYEQRRHSLQEKAESQR